MQSTGEVITVLAGAPHQVQNMTPCVKVAFDYVKTQGLPALATLAWTDRHLVPRANKVFNLPQDYFGLLHRITEHLARIADFDDK